MSFLRRVDVGDTVCCYTALKRIGRTSITLDVEIWVLRQGLSGIPASPASGYRGSAAA